MRDVERERRRMRRGGKGGKDMGDTKKDASRGVSRKVLCLAAMRLQQRQHVGSKCATRLEPRHAETWFLMFDGMPVHASAANAIRYRQ